MQIKRGDVFWADLTPGVGDEQGGIRYVLVVQSKVVNETGVEEKGTILVVPMTAKTDGYDKELTVEVPEMSELFKYKALIYQLRAISSMRFKQYVGHVSSEVMVEIEEKLKIVLGF